MSGRISFIGAGPGAADLITMRGARRLAEADVVLWSASLVAPECVWENARTDAEMVDSSRLRHEEAVEIFRRAERDKLNVVRMHSGDPSLWGEVQEQHDACARMDVQVEVVPGVAPFSAAAASVGRELTAPEVARSVVLARLDGGKTPMPDGAKVRELARHGTTMAVSLAAARSAQLVEELREGGYPEDTPVMVAYKISMPDELVLRTTLEELEATVKKHKLWRNALFLIGRAVAEGSRSRPYGSGSAASRSAGPGSAGFGSGRGLSPRGHRTRRLVGISPVAKPVLEGRRRAGAAARRARLGAVGVRRGVVGRAGLAGQRPRWDDTGVLPLGGCARGRGAGTGRPVRRWVVRGGRRGLRADGQGREPFGGAERRTRIVRSGH